MNKLFMFSVLQENLMFQKYVLIFRKCVLPPPNTYPLRHSPCNVCTHAFVCVCVFTILQNISFLCPVFQQFVVVCWVCSVESVSWASLRSSTMLLYAFMPTWNLKRKAQKMFLQIIIIIVIDFKLLQWEKSFHHINESLLVKKCIVFIGF